jgi:hypothetical protein
LMSTVRPNGVTVQAFEPSISTKNGTPPLTMTWIGQVIRGTHLPRHSGAVP